MNDIYLNTLAKGILEFSNGELVSLQRMAVHCPQEGGTAVHQARGILSIVQDIDILNFDCIGKQTKKDLNKTDNQLSKNWEIILYPNPTATELNLKSNINLEAKWSIEVYNTLGQLVNVKFMKTKNNELKIDVQNLLNGVYIIHLTNGDKVKTTSFVVSK